jgi:hypothetical protein
MRRLSLLAVICVLCSGWLLAQSSSSQSSSSGTETSVSGCLQGSAGSYILTDDSGKTYQLQGANSKLKGEVGHVIKVRGMEAGASSTGSSSSPGGDSSASGSTQFQVKSVSRVSDSCTGVTPK